MKNKNFGFWEVFSISSGAMISSGLFVLPAVIYAMAGDDVVWGYALAGIMVFPTLFLQGRIGHRHAQGRGHLFLCPEEPRAPGGKLRGLCRLVFHQL
jgi:APA family basic amino acid/polyamine antiporter